MGFEGVDGNVGLGAQRYDRYIDDSLATTTKIASDRCLFDLRQLGEGFRQARNLSRPLVQP